MMVAAMDEAGVDKAALVHASTAYGYDNTYVAEAVAAHPKRFAGVFSVDVLAPDAVAKIEYWMQRGLTGLRLFTTGSTMRGQATWFDDPRTYPAWEYAGEVGLPVCMQMTPQGFPQLRELMRRFPEVRIILDHLARPQVVDGPPYAADRELLRVRGGSERVSEGDADQLHARRLGQGHAGEFLRQAGRRVRRKAHRLGLEFSGDRRHAEGQSRAGQKRLASLSAADRMDLRQDRAVSPHGPIEVSRGSSAGTRRGSLIGGLAERVDPASTTHRCPR